MTVSGFKLLVIGDHQENIDRIRKSPITTGSEMFFQNTSNWRDAVTTIDPPTWDAILLAFKEDIRAEEAIAEVTRGGNVEIPHYVISDSNESREKREWKAVGARLLFTQDSPEQMAQFITHDLVMLRERAALQSELQSTREECRELVRKNTAWRELFDHLNEENRKIKQQIASNVERAIMPTIQELKQSPLSKVRRLALLLEQGVTEITSPFLHSLQGNSSALSPRELEVCHLIRAGLSSKEIASTLRLSPATVQKHRELIRKKLGIVNLDTNLQVYLQSI